MFQDVEPLLVLPGTATSRTQVLLQNQDFSWILDNCDEFSKHQTSSRILLILSCQTTCNVLRFYVVGKFCCQIAKSNLQREFILRRLVGSSVGNHISGTNKDASLEVFCPWGGHQNFKVRTQLDLDKHVLVFSASLQKEYWGSFISSKSRNCLWTGLYSLTAHLVTSLVVGSFFGWGEFVQMMWNYPICTDQSKMPW